MDKYRIENSYESTGEELRSIFLASPENRELKSQKNIEILLNYLLLLPNYTEEDIYIIDYCVNFLDEGVKLDTQRKKEYYDKLMMEVDAKGFENQEAESFKLPDQNGSVNLDSLFFFQMFKLKNKYIKTNFKALMDALNRSIQYDLWERIQSVKIVMKRVSAAAAIIGLCLLSTEMASRANGESFFTNVVDMIQKNMTLYFNADGEAQLTELEKAPLNWIPDGFRLFRTDQKEYQIMKVRSYQYTNDVETFNFRIVEIFQKDIRGFTELDEEVMNFNVNNKVYYLMQNAARNKIVWYKGDTAIFYLEGDLTSQCLKEIILNNYGGE